MPLESVIELVPAVEFTPQSMKSESVKVPDNGGDDGVEADANLSVDSGKSPAPKELPASLIYDRTTSYSKIQSNLMR